MQIKEVAMAFFSRKQPDLDGEMKVSLFEHSLEFLFRGFLCICRNIVYSQGQFPPLLSYDTSSYRGIRSVVVLYQAVGEISQKVREGTKIAAS